MELHEVLLLPGGPDCPGYPGRPVKIVVSLVFV